MRLALILGGLLAVFVALSAWLIFRDNPWKPRAAAAETQSQLNADTGAIADKAGQATTRIIVQSEALAHEVESAPGGDTPLPDDVRSGWLSAIERMRQPAAGGDTDHSAEPAG